MKLCTLHVAGFGRLNDARFTFGPGLTVVVGPNEAGKSTLASALVAALYGLARGEKERYRPWHGGTFASTLVYETADGARWEIRREFDRDAKGLRVYDADGADAAARLGDGRVLVPGEAHLGISHDVFLQTACVRQRSVALDGAAADGVSAALARALGGGPREDAAIGALKLLDDALKRHVGTQRATKNAPLRALRAEEDKQRNAADAARATLETLGDLRGRISAQREARDRDAHAAAALERRISALRAAHLRARLANLRRYRDELADMQADRARFDDVAEFRSGDVGALDDAYHSWRSMESVAAAAAHDVAAERLDDAEQAELRERRADAGTLDDNAFAAVRAAAAHAEAARARAAAAAADAAAARREGDGGRALAGLLAVAALLATAGAFGLAIAHLWAVTAVVAIVALVLVVSAAMRGAARAARRRDADAKQRIADAALSDEAAAADAVARVLEPRGIATIDELIRRRERFVALSARAAAADKAEARATVAREGADGEAGRFDALAGALVGDVAGTREERRAAAHARAARRRERDGIDAGLAMLTMRRGQILGSDDDFTLQAQFDALIARGVEPAADDDAGSLHALEREFAEIDARAREAERAVAILEGQLQAGEDAVADLATLDESLAATRANIAALEAFERAIVLARTTIEARKDEAHRAFARRLEEYSADVLGSITGGRYGEIRVDPGTLAIRVRVPETGAIEEVDTLSAGTRDQVALVVRFATARMFAEGLETPPLLLDDPFAFWDTARIARCVPVLMHGAQGAQTILFTASEELAQAAQAAGAARIALPATAVLA